jgi:hypothetical protein
MSGYARRGRQPQAPDRKSLISACEIQQARAVAGGGALIQASFHKRTYEAQWLLGLRQARLKILLINSNLLSGSFPKGIKAGATTRIGRDARRIRRFIPVAGIAEYYARHNRFRGTVRVPVNISFKTTAC